MHISLEVRPCLTNFFCTRYIDVGRALQLMPDLNGLSNSEESCICGVTWKLNTCCLISLIAYGLSLRFWTWEGHVIKEDFVDEDEVVELMGLGIEVGNKLTTSHNGTQHHFELALELMNLDFLLKGKLLIPFCLIFFIIEAQEEKHKVSSTFLKARHKFCPWVG